MITWLPQARHTPCASFWTRAFAYLDLDWREHVETDPRYFRPGRSRFVARATPARLVTSLGWEPKVSFKELVTLMVDHDLELAKQESAAQKAKGLEPAAKAGWGTI